MIILEEFAKCGECKLDDRMDGEKCGICGSSKRFSFSIALHRLKNGDHLQRAGWNGKGMYIFMMPSLAIEPENINDRMIIHLREKQRSERLQINKYISMMNSRGEIQPGWLASQEDMLAEDWMIVNIK